MAACAAGAEAPFTCQPNGEDTMLRTTSIALTAAFMVASAAIDTAAAQTYVDIPHHGWLGFDSFEPLSARQLSPRPAGANSRSFSPSMREAPSGASAGVFIGRGVLGVAAARQGIGQVGTTGHSFRARSYPSRGMRPPAMRGIGRGR
jgi:hypothetical protein